MGVAEYLAIASGLILTLWALYFCWKTAKQGVAYVKCRRCGELIKVPRKTEPVRKAEQLFQGKAIPVIRCGNCGR